MRKRPRLRDFTVRVSDEPSDDASCCVNGHLRVCLAGPKPLLVLALLVVFAVPLVGQTSAAAPDAGSTSFETPSRRYLFGDWGGKRTALEERGIKFDFFYIADLEANPSGGLQQAKAGWERIRGTIDISFDGLVKWQGLRFHSTGLWQVGANLGA